MFLYVENNKTLFDVNNGIFYVLCINIIFHINFIITKLLELLDINICVCIH